MLARRKMVPRPPFVVWIVVASALVACETPSTQFHGIWTAPDPPAAALYEGSPRLAIGHYGTGVAGVLYFHKAPGSTELVDGCPCAYIDDDVVDTGRSRFSFSIVFDADTVPQCEQGEGDGLDWFMQRASDNDPDTDAAVLDGEVRRSDGQGTIEAVRLVRIEATVSNEDMWCPPPE